MLFVLQKLTLEQNVWWIWTPHKRCYTTLQAGHLRKMGKSADTCAEYDLYALLRHVTYFELRNCLILTLGIFPNTQSFFINNSNRIVDDINLNKKILTCKY